MITKTDELASSSTLYRKAEYMIAEPLWIAYPSSKLISGNREVEGMWGTTEEVNGC